MVEDQNITDVRTYDMTVDRKGCWVARQTGTDVGATGHPVRPDHPDRRVHQRDVDVRGALSWRGRACWWSGCHI